MTGELVVFQIDKCAPAYVGAISLYKLVHQIVEMLAANVSAMDEFVLKLGAAGYIDMQEYDKQYFSITSRSSYCVDDSFPKIVRAALSVEIVNAAYQLDLLSLNPWAR